ncbi:MAG TPA: hypothetical protein VKR83_16955 [Ktedonobacteraceae bacterium]|nr:hypothetical protein [Ktedonobacteraceae bacterium]
MKAQSSRLLPVSIGVAIAAILSILINVLANILFGKSLNSSGYYALVIILAAASIVFGVLQILPGSLASSRANDAQQTHPGLLESDIYGEKHALHNLVSDIIQQAYPDLVSELNRHYKSQEQMISTLFKKLMYDLEEITKQNRLMLNERDVTYKQLDHLTDDFKANSQQLSIITQQLKDNSQQNQQSHPIKLTIEIHGVPISIETPDENKAKDIANLLMQLTQTISSPAVEQKAQQSVVRESEGTYRRVEDTGTFQPGAESEQAR